ncbi:hypothetical protein SLS62_004879 [Diatrype stigma]|uniref:DUF1772 domain-containing protein n=1 Tax=Diatrype stigma TaxID=117547 RepID=A0AAN9UTX7_9PEZI
MVLMPLIHLSQAALASYGALHSYGAITRLQRYEAPTEQLARHSGEAGRQLRETRATQAAAALALAASLLASLYLAFRGGSRTLAPAAALALVAALVSARARAARYWGEPREDGGGVGVGEKAGMRLLPKMGSYEEARGSTATVLRTLDWLAYSWVVAAVVGLVRGY